ncbi:ribosome recycling factor [Desulfuromonas thiophila]|jgi:ribosome recycling factor|uniref:Ribosome-recycling factor n=1 Tax=Desulfuromonas thiophila TaxID=57664 RepID=A0A1G7AS28_9BACT|nr:ribosome recycling factor [Desulfuromonas thiophila]MCK9171873.1 ribosome recycling factor [Desulfuromonas thiophila]MDD3800810.1 ribosome recycling factor [Desulfuromonas thiophila]MDY0398515.1 ribosome recycling factor [Desulfuromonas thiophila]SDE16726.1 ribosome recycling factor [Desulfuromonas thiophila]
MIQDVQKKAKSAMEKAIDALKREFRKVRTGRASVDLLDEVRVDYYGTPTPLNQVGTLVVPEPRMITIQPWEKSLLPQIEKAIFKSDLGLTPSSDGELVRIVIPPLNEERRREMVKVIKAKAEDAKISIRAARRDANEALKKLEKDKDITEDDLKRGEKLIQELTDKYVHLCEEVIVAKEKELMEV